MLEDEGWELRWPADLLVSEGNWILSLENEPGTVFLDGCMNLLEEAFVGNAARDAFLSGQHPDGGSIGSTAFIRAVIQDAPLFTVAGDRPYWPSRRGVGGKGNRLDAKEVCRPDRRARRLLLSRTGVSISRFTLLQNA